VSRRGAYAAYIGSGEFPVRLRVLGDAAIGPGESGFVRLWLGTALPLAPGDRFVLRESGRAETVGGGEILDVDPIVPAARARPDRSVERMVRERGWVDAADLTRLSGIPQQPTLGRWVVDPAVLEEARARLRAAVSAAGSDGLDVASLGERDRAVLNAGLDGTTLEEGRAREDGVLPRGLSDAATRVLAALEGHPWTPPDPDPADRAALRELARAGMAVEAAPLWFAASAVEAATRKVAELLEDRPDGVTVAEVRDALGISRKFALPLLAQLDAGGFTRRRGDVRVAGPRLPRPV
jgi:selenocysteine-specific elongation factor